MEDVKWTNSSTNRTLHADIILEFDQETVGAPQRQSGKGEKAIDPSSLSFYARQRDRETERDK